MGAPGWEDRYSTESEIPLAGDGYRGEILSVYLSARVFVTRVALKCDHNERRRRNRDTEAAPRHFLALSGYETL